MDKRRYDIDWLRILAVLLLFDFHTARIFDPWGFYVKNETGSKALEIFVTFVGQWHMHLFFMLSGVGTYYALQHRSGAEYVRERFKRLFVPLVFGTLVIVPPQVYCRLLTNPDYDSSYLGFYPQFFNGVAPEGNFEWGQLWFLAYLFVFSILALKFFTYLRSEKGKNIIGALGALCGRPGGIFLLALPIAIIEGALRQKYPNGNQNLFNDWANFFTYLTFFVYGYLLFSDERIGRAIERSWKLSGVLAMVFLAVLLVLDNIFPDSSGYSAGEVTLNFIKGFHTWFWLIFILGLGRRFLNFGGPALKYASEAALPFYILHQTAIVIVGYHVIKLSTGVFVKFIFIDIAAFLLSLFLYDIIIKRINPVRFLFGMRVKKAEQG